MVRLKEKIIKTKLLPDQAALFYIGQVGFIIKYRDTYIMIDGYLSDYVDKNCCSQQVKWERLYPAPMDAGELDFLDYIFCTHPHFDHADPWTISEVAKVNDKVKFVGPASVTGVYPKYGAAGERILKLCIDERTVLSESKGISVTMIPSAHEELHPDNEGGYEEVGYRFEFGDISIYHSGDCCPYEGLEERIRNCDALIMPVNGRDYYRKNVKDIIGCFEGIEAITIAQNTDAGMLIPVHWDLYRVNEINPGSFVDLLHRTAPELAFHIFVPGEKYVIDKM